MPHYFFHLIHPDRDPVRDDEGMTFEDDASARREGIASLGDLISDATKTEPIPLNVTVQIVRVGVGIIALLTAQIAQHPQPEIKL